MECWHCERPAHGVCIFCGRGICKEHHQTLPNLVSIYEGNNKTKKGIVVDNALFCGECRPREEPVALENLD